MKHLKFLGWLAGLLCAAGLLVLVRWHSELQNFVSAHRDVTFYLLLALLLTIPARIIALMGAYSFELLLVGWPRSSLKMLWKPSASVRLDMVSILVMLLLPNRRLGFLLSFGLLFAIEAYAAHHADFSLTHHLPTWELQMVCFVLFQSFVQYWMHRLEHSIPALWALHKFHHSADRMSILTSARQTQFVQGVQGGLVLLPMGLLTSPTAPLPVAGSPIFFVAVIFFVYQTLVTVNGYLVHSNLQTGYGWIGKWLIVSPRMHRLHHAVAPAYHDKNFTFDLVIWDRLFGTYAECDSAVDPATIPLGLEENPFTGRTSIGGVLRNYFLTTYIVFWQELRKGFMAWMPASAVGDGPKARQREDGVRI
jgi:sterol desaturase/sphingolipid hydroxylase (fatty acid hydroxylase superfamily)